jgi:hypothetical protein
MVRHSAEANLATIRNGLAEVWTTQGRRFVTFEADGDDAWIQYLDGELNVFWPLGDDPASALASRGVPLPRGAFPGWHVAGQNAVFEVGDATLDDVAQFIDALFVRVLDVPAGAPIAARVESHS